MNKLDTILSQFRTELGKDFISTVIVGNFDGMLVSGSSIKIDFDAEDIAARFTEVMRLTHDVTYKTSIGMADFNLITTDQSYIISQFLNDEMFFWLVVVSRNSTLGTVRMLMAEYVQKVSEYLPKFEDLGLPPREVFDPAFENKEVKEEKEVKPETGIWDAGKSKNKK